MEDKTVCNVNNDNKRKKHYGFSASKRKRAVAQPGMRGFLCSCNFREKECVRESYNILNEYADSLYGLEVKEDKSNEAEEPREDIDNLLKEIEDLKAAKTKLQRFQVVESGAKNFLFIRTTLEDPAGLAYEIVKDIDDTKSQKTRFLLRLIPVEITCKAYLEDIKKAFEPLLKKYFKDKATSYSVICNRRNNNHLLKDDVITCIAALVAGERSDHSVNLKNAELSIVIEVIRNVAFMAIVRDFLKYKKYNLHVISNVEDANVEASNKDEINS